MALKKAQIALPFILLVSGIIIEIVIAGSLTSYFASGSSYSLRLASRSSAAAYAGLNDALMQISRNKDFGLSNPTYGIALGSDSATVSFQSTVFPSYYTYTITVLGVANTRQTKVIGVVNVNRQNGLVEVQSINEVAIN